jgi:hypothetical protein
MEPITLKSKPELFLHKFILQLNQTQTENTNWKYKLKIAEINVRHAELIHTYLP